MLLGESSQNSYIYNGCHFQDPVIDRVHAGQLNRLFVDGHDSKGVLTNDSTTSIGIAGHGLTGP